MDMVKIRWGALSAAGVEKYKELAREDKKRYEIEKTALEANPPASPPTTSRVGGSGKNKSTVTGTGTGTGTGTSRAGGRGGGSSSRSRGRGRGRGSGKKKKKKKKKGQMDESSSGEESGSAYTIEVDAAIEIHEEKDGEYRV